MTDLFGKREPAAPLADALRPQSLDERSGGLPLPEQIGHTICGRFLSRLLLS